MLKYFKEPTLSFGAGQTSIDPRDGLILFGPNEKLAPYKIRVGVIGTKKGLEYYHTFVEQLNRPIFSTKNEYGNIKSDELARPSFPGFESVFSIGWPIKEEVYKNISSFEIAKLVAEPNKNIRTSNLVDLYLNKIIEVTNEDDSSIDIWFIVVPNKIYKACKPMSKGKDFSKETKKFIKLAEQGQTSLKFEGISYEDEIRKYTGSSSDFHHLMKAELIINNITTPAQLILEDTLQFIDKSGKPFQNNMKAHLAWTQSTTLYYKLGKLPWKLSSIRDGVCYLGLIFKRLDHLNQKKKICSAAQMFLKDGDGSVFRGSIGNWQKKKYEEYHLDRDSAYQLIDMALDDYKNKIGEYPKEFFIHGRAHLSKEEWEGFTQAINDKKANSKLTGVIIKEYGALKLFRDIDDELTRYGVLRGIAYLPHEREGFLFTRGYIPRLKTSSSLEIPKPLRIKISKGGEDVGIETVIQDVLALTKLNYNSCIHGDGFPVTLRFSDNIGSILTAKRDFKANKRQFKYYI